MLFKLVTKDGYVADEVILEEPPQTGQILKDFWRVLAIVWLKKVNTNNVSSGNVMVEKV